MKTFTENLAMKVTQHSSHLFQISLSRSRSLPHHSNAAILEGTLASNKASQAHRKGFCATLFHRGGKRGEADTSLFQSSASSLGLSPLTFIRGISGSKPQPILIFQMISYLLDFHSSITRIQLPLPHLLLRSITSFLSFSFEPCGATNVQDSVLSIPYRQYAEKSSPSKPTGTCLNGVTTSIGPRVPHVQ